MIFIRLWHIDLIPYLPKSQLLAQWRELNSIFKKQDKHLLINYVYDYPVEYLWCYTQVIINEMRDRRYDIKRWDNYNDYFSYIEPTTKKLVFKEHNKQYLTMNYWNLAEKYIRGQKDFTTAIWKKLDEFYKKEMGNE